LIRRAKAGDLDAVARLWSETVAIVQRVCKIQFAREEDREDFVSGTAGDIIRRLERFEGTMDNWVFWCVRIVQNKEKMWFREQRTGKRTIQRNAVDVDGVREVAADFDMEAGFNCWN
jgi:DNA-directed RNA polymerase specialized sigma24 family protein